VEDFSARSFGLLIAYIIPGYACLWGVAALSPAVYAWLGGFPEPTLGSFLYVVLGSVTAGMFVSAVRWATVDTVLHRTGLKRPVWDDSKLSEKLPAVEFLVENYYRYYEFYSGLLVSVLFTYTAWRTSPQGQAIPFGLADGGVVFVVSILAGGSRDTLRRYYQRATILLGANESEGSHDERRRTSDGGQRKSEGGTERKGQSQHKTGGKDEG
jgi:hypothetical protein